MLPVFPEPALLDELWIVFAEFFLSGTHFPSHHNELKLSLEAALFDKPADGIGSLLQQFFPYMMRKNTENGE